MTTKRKHRNTSRLTARERAQAFFGPNLARVPTYRLCGDELVRAFEAHARQTLARYKRRFARAAEKAMGK